MTPQILPLGLINLGTILKNNGFEVNLIDFLAEKEPTLRNLSNVLKQDEFLLKFRKFNPDIVGITTYTENYLIALTIAQLVKNEDPNVTLCIGGPHVTFQVEECLSNNQFIDIVVRGETEHIITDLVKYISKHKELKEIDNIGWRENSIIKFSNSFTQPNLENVPAPDLNLIKGKYYSPNLLHVEFSRGCPFHCVFCSLAPFSSNKVRYFPIRRMLNCIEEFQAKYKEYHFFVTDPTFMINPKLIEQFLLELKRSNLQLPEWNFQTRVDLINKDLLIKLKGANADQVTLGIEDIHDNVLKMIRKTQSFDQLERGIKTLKELGFSAHSNFIIGLPSQTRKQALENISYADKLDRFNFSVIRPFPGTPIFNQPEDFGLKILTKQWDLYTTYEFVMDSVTFPLAEQIEVRELAVRHQMEVYRARDLFNIWELAESNRLFNDGFDKWYEEWKENHYSGWS